MFLHGPYGLEWGGFLDSLAASHTVYAPEHPGTTPGDPDAVKPLDSLWDLVLLYYELLDKLGLDSPAVVGHSYGGMLAAELAATNPASVSKLALLNPIGLWRDDAPVKTGCLCPPMRSWRLHSLTRTVRVPRLSRSFLKTPTPAWTPSSTGSGL